MYIYIDVQKNTYTYTYTHIYIYIYIYTHTHIHIYIYTYTYTLVTLFAEIAIFERCILWQCQSCPFDLLDSYRRRKVRKPI